MNRPGRVFLVGAGPGDPELLTVKAVRALSQGDVVVYDRLVSPEVLGLVPKKSRLISVGKSPDCHPFPQAEINRILIHEAMQGHTVIRLKGGDPFIFGRGSEEASELARAGLKVDIIPGITAAQGCSAVAGVPLTHRGLASGVRFVTGHCRNNHPLQLDWDGLADPDTTLVIYMGAANIRQIASKLIDAGLARSTPVLAINNGTTPREKRLFSHLAAITSETENAEFSGPVLFIVGRVVSLVAEGAAPRLSDTRNRLAKHHVSVHA